MTKGTCSHCGRVADNLRKCGGACGGKYLYCNRQCQRADWSLHKKICLREGATAHFATFTLPSPRAGFPDVPLRAVHRLDGYGNSGVCVVFSDHLGIDVLIPYAKELHFCEDEVQARKTAAFMCESDEIWEIATTPVPPDVMELKPGEACFNTEKCGDTVHALMANGIIADTGKKVKLGYYPEFPICRVHLPQTDNLDEDMQ